MVVGKNGSHSAESGKGEKKANMSILGGVGDVVKLALIDGRALVVRV